MDNDLTLKQLKFAQWYLSHKRKLYRTLVGFTIAVNLVLWGIALYQFIFYLSSSAAYELMLKELTVERMDYTSLHKIFSPEDLVVDKPTIVGYPGGDRYDFVVSVENPNPKWRVSSMSYYFFSGNQKTETGKSFILPGQEKRLLVFGQEIGGLPSNLGIDFSEINWKRVRPEEQEVLRILPEVEVKEIDLGFAVSEQKLISLPEISFKVLNRSIYSFWQIDFIVILYDGDRIVGVNVLPVKKILGNEERRVELLWPSIPFSTAIQVIPDFDVFDFSNFMSNV